MYIVTERTEVLDYTKGRFHYDPYQQVREVMDQWDRLISLEISDAQTSQIKDTHNRQDDTSIDMVQQEPTSMDIQCEDGLAESTAPEVQEVQDQSNPESENSKDIQFIEVANYKGLKRKGLLTDVVEVFFGQFIEGGV